MNKKTKNTITFAEHAEIVLKLKKFEVRNNTYVNHWRRICDNHLLPYFGDMPIDIIKLNDISLYFISKSHMKRESLKSQLAALHEIFENACANDIIDKNPCENYRLKVGKESDRKRVYTKEQAELILKYCPYHRYGLEIDIMLRTGISRSELLGICWDDIDIKNRTIYIHKGVTSQEGNYDGKRILVSKTKNKFRTREIAIEDETLALINKHPRNIIVGRNKRKKIEGTIVKTEFLIYNKYGKVCAPDNWSKRHYAIFMRDMRNYYLERGIDIPILTPHELRHTRASIWVNDGKNPYAIAAQMGWADFEMLNKVYGHRDMNELRKQLGI